MENIKNKYPEIPIGRAEDITGMRSGRLEALYRTTDLSRTRWVCKCDCGNYSAVQTQSFKEGHTQSCGCLANELSSLRFIDDITGQTFGELTVLKELEERRTQKVMWLCECSCGVELATRGGDLKSGKTQSCGCLGSSIGELNIRKILDKNNIKYQSEFSFDDLRNPETNALLWFDFVVFSKDEISHIIEFDGSQHFEQSNRGEPLKDIQYRDDIKNQYCKDNNIPLIRIPYWKRDELTLEMLMI